MSALIHHLTNIGSRSIHIFWVPLLLWTIMALLGKAMLHFSKRLSARQLYRSHLALLGALPTGYLAYFILHALQTLPTVDTVASSFAFIPFELPATVSVAAAPTTAHQITLSADTWVGIIESVLIIGVIVMLLRLIIDQVKLHRFSKKLNRPENQEVSDISIPNRNLIQSLRRKVRITFYDGDTIPMTFGLFKPVIVLPDTLRKDQVKTNLAIRHELQHILQHDYLRFCLIRLLRVIFWFHPLVWLLEKDIIMFREMDIDETVISQNRENSSEYAHLLLDLAGSPTTQHLSPTGLATRPSTVKQRITAMTQTGKTRNYRWISASLTIMTLFIALAMGCSDMQNQDLSGKKLAGQKFTFSNFEISINSHVVFPFNETIKMPQRTNFSYFPRVIGYPASGITKIKLLGYGTFLISARSFEGAKPSGVVSGSHLKFTTTDNQKIVINSDSQILPEKTATVWVEYVAPVTIQKGNGIGFSWVPDLDALHRRDLASAKGHKALQEQLRDTVNLDTFNSQISAARTLGHYVLGNSKKAHQVGDKVVSLMSGLQNIQDKIRYPESARKAGVEGVVYVEFTVDDYGNVTDAHVQKGIGYGCDQAALNAVKKTVFEPQFKNGKRVKVRYSLPIVFKL